MGSFFSNSTTSPALAMSSPSATVADGLTSNSDVAPKPCCVCKTEKASRDECMLFSNSRDPEKDCANTIDRYKNCMESFGFKLP